MGALKVCLKEMVDMSGISENTRVTISVSLLILALATVASSAFAVSRYDSRIEQLEAAEEKHEERIEAVEVECDDLDKVLVKIETDVGWIRQALENRGITP